jgi:hypothetical protein
VSSTYEVLLRARGFLMGSRRDVTTTITGAALTNTGASVVVGSGNGIATGSLLEIGRELLLVTNAAASPTLSVSRGYGGTTPTAHATGAYVVVNPTVPMQSLLDSANAELASLSSPANGLFRVARKDISTNLGKIGFDLGVDETTAFLDIISIRYRESNLGDWVKMDKGSWEIVREADTTDFPSGIGVMFSRGLPGTQTTRVVYKMAFGPLGDLTEDVPATTGLPWTAEDIVAMGAAIRVSEAREIARADLAAQPDPRRAAEIPMGNALQAASALRKSRKDRIAEEAARLNQQWARA